LEDHTVEHGAPRSRAKEDLFQDAGDDGDEGVRRGKHSRRSAEQLTDMRANPKLFPVTLPSVGEFPQAAFIVARPVLPTRELLIKFEDQTVNHVLT
jgi:hypothetical protein